MLRNSFLFILIWLTTIFPAQATSVLPLYLDEIVADSQVVFQGTCTANRTERDANTGFIVTYTTFEVQEILKGVVGGTHTIKQIGGKLGNENRQFQGVPTFTVGENYVVFLYGVSSAGFSSPVGLSQGKFRVRPGGAGGSELSNGRDFKEMLGSQPAQTLPLSARQRLEQTPGELKNLGLDEFKQIVRQLTGRVK